MEANKVRQIEELKANILEYPEEIILAALKGVEYCLLLRSAAEGDKYVRVRA